MLHLRQQLLEWLLSSSLDFEPFEEGGDVEVVGSLGAVYCFVGYLSFVYGLIFIVDLVKFEEVS